MANLLFMRSSSRKLLMIWFHTMTNFMMLFLSSSRPWKSTIIPVREFEEGIIFVHVLKWMKQTWVPEQINHLFIPSVLSFTCCGMKHFLKASGNVRNLLLSIPNVRICKGSKWEHAYTNSGRAWWLTSPRWCKIP